MHVADHLFSRDAFPTCDKWSLRVGDIAVRLWRVCSYYLDLHSTFRLLASVQVFWAHQESGGTLLWRMATFDLEVQDTAEDVAADAALYVCLPSVPS